MLHIVSSCGEDGFAVNPGGRGEAEEVQGCGGHVALYAGIFGIYFAAAEEDPRD